MHFLLVVIMFSYQVVAFFHISQGGNNNDKVEYYPLDDFYSFHI
jgi:hypothetical protein